MAIIGGITFVYTKSLRDGDDSLPPTSVAGQPVRAEERTAENGYGERALNSARQTENPKHYELSKGSTRGTSFRPVNGHEQVRFIGGQVGLTAEKLAVLIQCYNRFVVNVAMIEASEAIVQMEGADKWYVRIPNYNEQAQEAVKGFFKEVQSTLLPEDADKFLNAYARDGSLATIGTERQEYRVTRVDGALIITRKAFSTDSSSVVQSESQIPLEQIPDHFLPLVSILPHLKG